MQNYSGQSAPSQQCVVVTKKPLLALYLVSWSSRLGLPTLTCLPVLAGGSKHFLPNPNIFKANLVCTTPLWSRPWDTPHGGMLPSAYLVTPSKLLLLGRTGSELPQTTLPSGSILIFYPICTGAVGVKWSVMACRRYMHQICSRYSLSEVHFTWLMESTWPPQILWVLNRCT